MGLLQDIKIFYLTFKETSAPVSPSSGEQKIFIDSADHLLKLKDSSGTVTTIGSVEYPWAIQIFPFMPPNDQSNWNTIITRTDASSVQLPDYIQSSGAQNAYIEFKVLLGAGTWELWFAYLKNNNNGIFTAALDGSTLTTADAYNASLQSPIYSTTGSINVATSGQHLLRFTMASKNASSAAYYGQLMAIQMRRTA